jgi:hypothetical protein
MKTINHLLVLAALSQMLGAQALQASEPFTHIIPPPKTNNVMALNIALIAWPNATAYSPDVVENLPIDNSNDSGDTTRTPAPDLAAAPAALLPQTASSASFSITSRDIITSLNGVTNNGVVLNFGATAQLMFKQILSPHTLVVNSFGTNRLVIVRQTISHKTTDTDISAFFVSDDHYVSTLAANGAVQWHKLSSLSFVNPNKLGWQLSALVAETTAPPQTNGVAALISLGWNTQGSGETSGSTPNLIIGGTIATGPRKLE